MLGVLGNMISASSSRYGRAVKSPDFAKAAAHGILTNELQRRDNEQRRLEAIRHQQQMDAQREKARRDADERAWNHAYKASKDAADDRWRRDKDARDAAYRKEQFEYQKQRDADRLAFDKERAEQQRRISYSRLAEQRKSRESREDIEKVKIAIQAQRAANGGANRDDVVLPVPGYQHGLHVAKGVWNGPTRKLVLGMLVREAEEQRKKDVKAWRENEEKTDLTYKWFKTGPSTPKPRNWFDVNFGGVDDSSTDEDMILAYIATHVDSEASKQAIKMLEDMSYDGGGNPRYVPDNNFYDEDDPWGGTFW